MTDTQDQRHADPEETPEIKLPNRPRFTLDDLQEIRIAEGDGESTIAAYSFTHKGQTVERIARLDDLTRAEREAVLSFILTHAPAVTIRRRKPKKQREGYAHDAYPTRLYNTEAVEFEPIDVDALTAPQMPEFEPIEGLTAQEQGAEGAEAPQTRDSAQDGLPDGQGENTRQNAQE